MIAALIICAICAFIIGINIGISKLFEYKIARTPIAKKAVRYRMVYNVIRVILIILFVGICFLFFYLMGDILLSMSDTAGKFTIVSIFGLLFLTFSSLRFPVHAYTKEDIRDEKFVLYLRGFMTDKYDISTDQNTILSYFNVNKFFIVNTSQQNETQPEELPFSEEKLAKAIGKKMPLYCVGQPKEVYSPHGCKRVYLDHEKWKEDVVDLINKATYVFILLHDTENCQWEIVECADKAAWKTIYLIEDKFSYDELITSMGEATPEMLSNQDKQISDIFTGIMEDLTPNYKHKLQELSDTLDKSQLSIEQKEKMFSTFTRKIVKLHCAVYQKNGEVFTTRYRNTISGLQRLMVDLSA